jgi:6-phosphogluconolactonase (cycloisomerase 2 family)
VSQEVTPAVNHCSWNPTWRAALASLVLAMAALAFAISGRAQSPQASKSRNVALYAAVGPELIRYEVDVGNATLTKRESVMLPDSVQYAWPHPSGRYIYVAWSNGAGADHHGLTAFLIDPLTGALHVHGKPLSLSARPIHVTVDVPGTHVLVAYNDPSGVTVHRIAEDGTIGSPVPSPTPLDAGVYAHQVRVHPSNDMVILVTRGNGPTTAKPEDPGALKVLSYKDGLLASRASIAPGGGFNFQPRHLDFSGPWVFVSLERQSKLQVYKRLPDGTLSQEPLFTKDSLTEPNNVRPGQVAGTVHVHPNGKFVYQANRASGTIDYEGKRVFAGGENAIAVYAINQETGEPSMIQNIDTRGSTPRTFALDGSGRLLVAANQNAMLVRDGQNVRTVPASLAVYKVRDDGRLDFARKYDVETPGAKTQFWMGLVSLP